VAGFTTFVVETIGHTAYPPAAGFDPTTPAGMAAIVGQASFGALLFVIVAYACGACVGGAVAARLRPAAPIANALVVGAVLLGAGVLNLLAIPHPVWMAVATVVVFVPAAWFGGRLSDRRG
jgi:hypothetical protein